MFEVLFLLLGSVFTALLSGGSDDKVVVSRSGGRCSWKSEELEAAAVDSRKSSTGMDPVTGVSAMTSEIVRRFSYVELTLVKGPDSLLALALAWLVSGFIVAK